MKRWTIADYRAELQDKIKMHQLLAQQQMERVNKDADSHAAQNLAHHLKLATSMQTTLRHMEYFWQRDGEDVDVTRARLLTYMLSFIPTTPGLSQDHINVMAGGVIKAVRIFDAMFPHKRDQGEDAYVGDEMATEEPKEADPVEAAAT